MAMVESRLRAWRIGRGRLGSGLSGLLAFCWATTTRRYIVSCFKDGLHERGLPGLGADQKATSEINSWTSDETEELARLYRAKRDLAVLWISHMAKRTTAIHNSMFWTA